MVTSSEQFRLGPSMFWTSREGTREFFLSSPDVVASAMIVPDLEMMTVDRGIVWRFPEGPYRNGSLIAVYGVTIHNGDVWRSSEKKT
jgi:hypothetical protein